MLLRWSFLAVIALMAMVRLKAASQPGPGFDCPNEKGPMERIICADKELGLLDATLAQLYLRVTPARE